MPMAMAADYRKYAADCLRLAKTAQVQDSKTILLEMAQRWYDLANKLERDEEKRKTTP
jgi:hypothetical protein